MSMVSGVFGGVDTHADVHVAAAIDTNGGMLGIESFPTDTAGYRSLSDWLCGFGPVVKVGVNMLGSSYPILPSGALRTSELRLAADTVVVAIEAVRV